MSTKHKPPVDYLVDEVRQRRRDLLAACGEDFDTLIRLIRSREAEHPERVADPRVTSQGQPRGAPRADTADERGGQ